MKLQNLKTIRVIVSLLFFLIFTFLLINPQKNIPQYIFDFFTSLQLIPSILNITVTIGITSFGLVIIFLLTIFFGRVYCSSICPLGTLQDLVIYLKKKISKNIDFIYKKPVYFFHYLFTTILGLLTLFGFISFLNLFEPYSFYGRILVNLVEPLVISSSNLFSSLLEKFSIFLIPQIPLRNPSIYIIILSIMFLGVIFYLAYNHGRLFCNSFCPAGAVLGIISRIAIFKIVIDEYNCTRCGSCESVCKANCIDGENQKIDYAACINCFNCIKACPTEAVVYNRVKFETLNYIKQNKSRRIFLKSTILPVVGLVNLKVVENKQDELKASNYFKIKKFPISPPGSIGIEHFTQYCTACHLCVSACPTQVLYPTFLEYGLGGIFQPRMNFTASYCNYECTICSDVCPTGAILPLSVEKKKTIQIGKAEFFKNDCVVVDKKKECAACSEHCPTKAVYMVPYEGKLKIPELNNDLCVGCGHCENACPTTPRKAIYIIPNKIHQIAKKPEVIKQEKISIPEEFPF